MYSNYFKTLSQKGANQFIPVAGYFFFPLMKYFEQKDKDELVIAHVIHTLTHVIHCAKIATVRLCIAYSIVAIVTLGNQ